MSFRGGSMRSKKGQGLSMNTIIIAAIALLILVILTTLVIRSTSNVGETNECTQTAGAYCEDIDDSDPNMGCSERDIPDRSKTCPDEDEICCIPQ